MTQDVVLVINSGSSSLKLGLYARTGETLLAEAAASGVGHAGGSLSIKDSADKELHAEQTTFNTQEAALAAGLAGFRTVGLAEPSAIGHRVVHGGPRLLQHQRITPEVIKTLEESEHFAPLHIPPALKLIRAAQKEFGELPEFACFDTVFHQTMPEAACHLPLPQEYWQEGVRRYGFHGLSYESIVQVLGAKIPARVVIAHLGSGCSVCAVESGRSVDTSMGFTPAGGVVMSTRTGDLDPGVLLYILRQKKLSADELEQLVNHDCGLAGLSGGDGDVQKLLASAEPAAKLAMEVFVRTIAKTIAGYASVLGGLDLLVFTGGIGEHSAWVREQVAGRLSWMGQVPVQAMTAEEDLQIARHCWRLLGESH